MTVNDRSRLDLHRRLEAVLGPEEAATLMAHLPPVTWQDVATKDDVRVLAAELRAEMAELRAELRDEIGELRAEMERGFTRQTKWMAGLMSGWAAVTLAAIGLFV